MKSAIGGRKRSQGDRVNQLDDIDPHELYLQRRMKLGDLVSKRLALRELRDGVWECWTTGRRRSANSRTQALAANSVRTGSKRFSNLMRSSRGLGRTH